MSKKRTTEKLGLDWKGMEAGKKHFYGGSHLGAKNNCCRASKRYKPKKFGWEWGDKFPGTKVRKIYVFRIA